MSKSSRRARRKATRQRLAPILHPALPIAADGQSWGVAGQPRQVPPAHPLAPLLLVAANRAGWAETILFRTVVLNAFYDAVGGDADAQLWLTVPSPDLTEVCDLASLCPYWVGYVARQLIAGTLGLPPYRIWRYFWSSHALAQYGDSFWDRSCTDKQHTKRTR